LAFLAGLSNPVHRFIAMEIKCNRQEQKKIAEKPDKQLPEYFPEEFGHRNPEPGGAYLNRQQPGSSGGNRKIDGLERLEAASLLKQPLPSPTSQQQKSCHQRFILQDIIT
jgi:hypothetical protein